MMDVRKAKVTIRVSTDIIAMTMIQRAKKITLVRTRTFVMVIFGTIALISALHFWTGFVHTSAAQYFG